MSIPAKHLKKLNYLVQAHQIIVKLGTDKKILAALNELSENPELRKQVAKDPAAYIKRKGISLPRGAKVTFRENWGGEINFVISTPGGGSVSASASYSDSEGFQCEVKAQ
jgi:tartrate dehydratase alpha subunit/fumarate hydratase class I-like protein